MSDTALRVVYEPMTRDLPNGSTHYGDEQTVDLVDWEEHEAGEYAGRRVRGRTADGVDVVIHLGSKRVRMRDRDEGAFRQFAGYCREMRGVTA